MASNRTPTVSVSCEASSAVFVSHSPDVGRANHNVLASGPLTASSIVRVCSLYDT